MQQCIGSILSSPSKSRLFPSGLKESKIHCLLCLNSCHKLCHSLPYWPLSFREFAIPKGMARQGMGNIFHWLSISCQLEPSGLPEYLAYVLTKWSTYARQTSSHSFFFSEEALRCNEFKTSLNQASETFCSCRVSEYILWFDNTSLLPKIYST